MARREVLVGYFTESDLRYRVKVGVELGPIEGGSKLTVEHDPAPSPGLEFRVSGSVDEYQGGRWRESGGGQCVDDLRKVTDFADGWDGARRDELVGLWERWHLNGMRAGCAHQAVEYETDQYGRRVPSLKLTKPCPESGYRYGSAWLVEVIPDDVLARMRRFVTGLPERASIH